MSTIKISQAPGIGQPNKFRDVQTVQSLLNSNKLITTPGIELSVDGKIGPRTIERIKEFQQKVVKLFRLTVKINIKDIAEFKPLYQNSKSA